MSETRDQLESSRAHWASRARHAEQRADKLYEKLRRLENKVRATIVVGESVDFDELYRLRQLVPNEPRPTLRSTKRSKTRR